MELALSPTYAPTKAQSTEYDVKKNMHKRGQCSNCGIQTHKVLGLFNYSLVPLTNGEVLSGRCLLCQPLPPASASAPPRLINGEAHGVSGVAIPSGDENPIGSNTNTENDPPAPVPRNSWWKEHQRLVIGGFVFIFVAVASAILGVMLGNDAPDVLGNNATTPDVLGNDATAVLGNDAPDVGGTSPSPPPTTPIPTLKPSPTEITAAIPSSWCSLCPEGSNVVFPNELSFNPHASGDFMTCAKFESYVKTFFSEDECRTQRDVLDLNAVKCGCLDSGGCSLCPGGSVPGNPNAFHSGGSQTCGELDILSRYSSVDLCEENKDGYAAQGFVCGCPGVEPACTLCFGSTSVPDPAVPLEKNGSCGLLNNEVLRLTPDECTYYRSTMISNAIQCGCQHDATGPPPTPATSADVDTVFAFEGTGSVIISCTDADDMCTPNGSLGGISGSFNIASGAYVSRDGGSTATFSEGNGSESATTITCTDGCTCVLPDGSVCAIGTR